MKTTLLVGALMACLLILPTKADEPQTGTWQIATAVAGNPAVWQLNTATGEMRMCQFIQGPDGSAIGCSGWIRASEQTNLKKKN